MQVSEQIIEVLNYICEKIGITIDWTSANIVPYLNELCEKYIRYEIATSTVWLVIGIICIVICAVIGKKYLKKFLAKRAERDSYSSDGDEYAVIAIICLVVILSIVPVPIYQIFDIVECCTIPEKTIFEYVQSLLQQLRG